MRWKINPLRMVIKRGEQAVESIIEALETLLGQRGDPLDRVLTIRDAYESGIANLRGVDGIVYQSPVSHQILIPNISSGTSEPGTPGVNTAIVYAYKRAQTTPTDGPGQMTWDFYAAAFTGPMANGWSATVPNGTDPLYVRTATAASTLGTDTIGEAEWSSPVMLVRNGLDGTSGLNGTRTAILEMYRWSASTPTTFPAGTSTYTWATGQFTAPASPNGWSLTPPAPVAGQNLYVCRQTYSDSETSATSIVTWNASTAHAISLAGMDGAPGANGQRVGILELYLWSVTQPTTFPAGTSTYTWATGEFTLPTTPNGWSLTPGTPIPGQTLWGVTAIVSDNLTTSTSIATWNSTTAYPVGYAGSNGVDGIDGKDGSFVSFIYKVSATQPATPTGGSYDGTNEVIPTGWTDDPTHNENDIEWISTTRYVKSGSTWSNTGWSTPARFYQKGDQGNPGLNVATAMLYKRTAGEVPGPVTGTVTYTFATGAMTGYGGGWSASIPTDGGRYLWVSRATASNYGAQDTIEASEWSSPEVLSINGLDGAGIETYPPVTMGTMSVISTLSSNVIEWTTPSTPRYAYTKIYRADTDTFPGESGMIGVSAGGFYIDVLGSGGIAKYYWIRHIDIDGNGTALNSATGTLGTTGYVTDNDISDDTIHGAKIKAGTIAADKIFATSLSAITANLGNITSGTLTLNAGGYIRGGSSAYATGAGYWLGYDNGKYKFSLVNTNDDSFQFDDNGMLIRGAVRLVPTLGPEQIVNGTFSSGLSYWYDYMTGGTPESYWTTELYDGDTRLKVDIPSGNSSAISSKKMPCVPGSVLEISHKVRAGTAVTSEYVTMYVVFRQNEPTGDTIVSGTEDAIIQSPYLGMETTQWKDVPFSCVVPKNMNWYAVVIKASA